MSYNLKQQKAWLIGTGFIAREYVKVLRALEVPFIVIGRSEERTQKFIEDTGVAAISGGLERFLLTQPDLPSYAINAVQAELGSDCICKMLDYGVDKILAEKPTGMSLEEVRANLCAAQKHHAAVCVAYNRRFFASTLAAQKIITEDGGVTSFHFEFTELYRVISKLKGDVSGWFYGNSTHVCDLAFFLGGSPRKMTSFVQKGMNGYTSTTNFAGAGVSECGALFSYQANYLAPGRWGVEVMTPQHRLIFRPMEQLQVQKIGSFEIEPMEIEDKLDKDYKPGFYQQMKTFIEDPHDPQLLTIEGQLRDMEWYTLMHEGGDSKNGEF